MALAPYPWLEEPAQTLLAMRDRMPNAVLLYGAPGAGLYELALAFSKSLFCLSPHSDGTPCGHCTGCRLAQAGTQSDNQGLKNFDSRVKEFHSRFSFIIEKL